MFEESTLTRWLYTPDPVFAGPGEKCYERIRKTRPAVIKQLEQLNTVFGSLTEGQLLYVVVNRVNLKLYVGKTINFPKRQRDHKNAAAQKKPKSLFHQAIKKYGWEAFDWYIYANLADPKRLNDGEKNLIAAILPEYNMTAGGDGALGKIGFWRGKKRPREQIEKMVATRRARGNFLGTIGPRTVTEKEANRLKEWGNAAANRNAVSILCVETGEVFSQIKLAAKAHKLRYGKLLDSLSKGEPCNGLTFTKLMKP